MNTNHKGKDDVDANGVKRRDGFSAKKQVEQFFWPIRLHPTLQFYQSNDAFALK